MYAEAEALALHICLMIEGTSLLPRWYESGRRRRAIGVFNQPELLGYIWLRNVWSWGPEPLGILYETYSPWELNSWNYLS
jgi:hypothetical protein